MAATPLPMRDGVAASYLWLPEGQWPDMLSFLVARYPQISAAQLQDRMARGEVVNGDGQALSPASPFRRGMRIFYYRELERETPIPFQEQILFEDEHLVVADKPHFLPMTPGGRFVHETLLTRLKKKLDCAELTPIHRLDRETAGVVIFSRQQASRGAYQTLFAPAVPTGQELMLNSVAFAAWGGMFVTMVNLLPVGQLDAGHVAFALFGPRQNAVARTVHRAILVFFGVGLGLIGRLSLPAIYAYAMALFALQCLWSRWWLARHAQGPIEALWRGLTYPRRGSSEGH